MDTSRENIFNIIQEKFGNLRIDAGTLYIVSTPIGNLDDISFRALYVLKNVDFIAAEDTRVTGFLLSQYGIKNKIISYYSQVENNKIDFIINEINSGKSVALASDAGTPCISDPGSILVSHCIEKGIKVVSIPGASSVTHSLVVSGFKNKQFYFQGFLPQKKGREKTFLELKEIKMSLVIFESKYKLKKTLNDCLNFLGNKKIVISRELTKKFEESVRGKLIDFKSGNLSIKEKGEFVLVIDNSK